MSTVTAVTLTRRRHPFEGRSLQVLGSMRRHGAAELLVVLPDGSKRLIPAAWTDLEQPGRCRRRYGDSGLGSGLAAAVCAGFGSFRPARRRPGAGCTEVTVQGGRPCSLCSSSLMWSLPASPRTSRRVPAPQVEAAIALLALLIAKAAAAGAAGRRPPVVHPATGRPRTAPGRHGSTSRQSTLIQVERTPGRPPAQGDLVSQRGSWAGPRRPWVIDGDLGIFRISDRAAGRVSRP